MSTRFISIDDINSVLAAIEDEKGIELLEKIKDNVVKPEAGGEGSKQQQQPKNKKEEEEKQEFDAFVGQTKEEDLGIKEDDGSKGVLDMLADKGLIIKGGYIPLNKERINSYKITNEGLALLYLVKKIKGVVKGGGEKSSSSSQTQQQQQQQQQPKQVTTIGNRGRER